MMLLLVLLLTVVVVVVVVDVVVVVVVVDVVYTSFVFRFFYAKHEGLPWGVLVPLFPSKIALCSHVPTHFPNVFVL